MFRKMKMQSKFFLTYLCMGLAFILIFAFVFFGYTAEILTERETKNMIRLNSSLLSQTETVLRDMDNVSINIDYSSLVMTSLQDGLEIPLGSDIFRNLANLFVTINGVNFRADQINLYNFNGDVVQVGIKSNSKHIDPAELTWMNRVRVRGGKKTISTPYQTKAYQASYSTNQEGDWYISLYRTLQNEYKKTIGVIETVKSCSKLFQHIVSYQKKSEHPAQVYIYDADGILIYPYDVNPQKLNQYDQILPEGGRSIEYFDKTNNSDAILAYETSLYTGWTYVTVQDKQFVLKPLHEMTTMLAIVVAALMVFCFFVSYELSVHLARPIQKMKQIMRQTAIENMGEERDGTLGSSCNELEALNQEFTQMSIKLKTSMDELIEAKQQEAHSRNLALQSQINPHFYYNTLASIMILAKNNQPCEVAELCKNLSSIMRYITDSHMSKVTMEKELDYVRRYLYCMKVRYQDSLRYTIDVDASILQEEVPKLIIQPLVENALKYGTDCEAPWTILIQSHVSEEEWRIDVIDNGNGFSCKALEKLSAGIQNIDIGKGVPELQINGLGLLNVYSRWKLHCREDMVFHCGNTKEGHGQVSIGRKYRPGSESNGNESLYCSGGRR